MTTCEQQQKFLLPYAQTLRLGEERETVRQTPDICCCCCCWRGGCCCCFANQRRINRDERETEDKKAISVGSSLSLSCNAEGSIPNMVRTKRETDRDRDSSHHGARSLSLLNKETYGESEQPNGPPAAAASRVASAVAASAVSASASCCCICWFWGVGSKTRRNAYGGGLAQAERIKHLLLLLLVLCMSSTSVLLVVGCCNDAAVLLGGVGYMRACDAN